MENTACLDAAIEYCGFDYFVYPTKPDKSPVYIKGLFEHGYKDATNDPQKIIDAWKIHPNFNISMSPKMSGFIVIDVDVNKDYDARPAWEIFRGDWNPELIIETPRGGYHIYAQHPDFPEHSFKSHFVRGIEIKELQIQMPPSVSIDGNFYKKIKGEWGLKRQAWPELFVELALKEPLKYNIGIEPPHDFSAQDTNHIPPYIMSIISSWIGKLDCATEGHRNNIFCSG
jgi:hypothetical protein